MDRDYEVSMKLRSPADRVAICWAVSLSTRIMGPPQSGQFQVEATGCVVGAGEHLDGQEEGVAGMDPPPAV